VAVADVIGLVPSLTEVAVGLPGLDSSGFEINVSIDPSREGCLLDYILVLTVVYKLQVPP
jgi:hypothetical protein